MITFEIGWRLAAVLVVCVFIVMAAKYSADESHKRSRRES